MISATELKKRILLDFDMDLVGIAPADALQGEPEGHRPSDLLPGAKSIIVFGRKVISGAFQAAFRTDENKLMVARTSYKDYAQEMAPIYLQMNAQNDICLYLEDTYHEVAMPLPFATQQYMIWDNFPAPAFADPYGQGMPLDIFKAAMAAGLGELGWSNRLLTPEYGPRQIISVILTTAELEPDQPYSGERLCDPEKCGICAKLCPTGAIPACGSRCKTKAVPGKAVEVADINVNACAVASTALRREFGTVPPVADVVDTYTPSDEELKEVFDHKRRIDTGGLAHFPTAYCDKCILYCPVGKWKETFYDRGVTQFNGEDFETGRVYGEEAVSYIANAGLSESR